MRCPSTRANKSDVQFETPGVRRDSEETDPDLTRRTLEDHSTNFFETLSGAKSTVYNIRHAVTLRKSKLQFGEDERVHQIVQRLGLLEDT